MHDVWNRRIHGRSDFPNLRLSRAFVYWKLWRCIMAIVYGGNFRCHHMIHAHSNLALLSTRFTFVHFIISQAMRTPFLTCVFNFKIPKLIIIAQRRAMEMMAAKFPPFSRHLAPPFLFCS